MRLIDADELMEHVWRDRLDSRELIAKMIDNAPTVKEISQEPKTDMLDKIRAEIMEIAVNAIRIEEKWARGLYYAIKVIDKYINPTGVERECEE